MKLVSVISLLLGSVLILAGCGGPGLDDGEMNEKHFAIMCLDGVQYWVRSNSGSHKGYMSPRFDPETSKVVKCRSVRDMRSGS